MAAVEVATEPPVEVFSWLKSLPLAPEYHPTLAEFQDPIAYILRIEKEASEYGICKIVPPVQPLPKKTLIANLNRSLAARNPSSSSKSAPAFATRQQGIGFCPRKPRPVQKPVWQSGETYTLQQFEEKAKQFEKSYLRRISKKNLSALEIETLFWKACADKPFSVEYVNDMPGSAFAPVNEKKWREAGEASTVGETPWNMRVVSRAKGSLLRFMKEEISGVTSPMLYIAMLFSWLAWHVEDHDLHGLNYLHMGAGKTWYGVPREAAVAFEEVIRVHGYGGEVNPLVTFSILSEKTTVMSPEVLINARIPCCRLVQNAGEYVVTFPRAYHSGFSHGFNSGEAANIATPEWLQVAKEAAIRRASINYPPLLSHYQLLYSFALTSCSSRLPLSICTEPRSSRLKDKKRSEGETMVKELFVQNVMQNNELLHVLGKGSSCIILPLNFLGISVYSELHGGSQSKVRHRFPLGLCSLEKALESSKSVLSNNTKQDRSLRYLGASTSVKGTSASVYERDKLLLLHGISNLFRSTAEIQITDSESESLCDGLLDHGFFSCVMCGILSFACVAVVQPKPAASHYLMSTNCSFFNDWIVDTEINSNRHDAASRTMDIIELNSCLDSECEPTCPDTGRTAKSIEDGLYDVPVHSGDYQVQVADQVVEIHSDNEAQNGISSLELLAFAYGDPSDSEEGRVETELSASAGDSLRACSLACDEYEQYRSACEVLPSKTSCLHDDSSWTSLGAGHDQRTANIKDRSEQNIELENLVPMESKKLEDACRDTIAVSRGTPARSAGTRHGDSVGERIEFNPADCSIPSSSPSTVSNCSSVTHFAETTNFIDAEISVENTSRSVRQRSIENSCGMHMFCLEHAMEVEKQLRPVGGVHMLLLCHPDYAKVEAEAKSLAEDLGINYIWNDIPFKDATKEDLERIQSGIYNEEALHGTEDWTVKLGINLYYSARLSRSPLCSRQMPYNAVIYSAFGCSFPANSLTKPKVSRRGHGKKKKKVVAGKWCGKVWMSNQVHPYLAQRNNQEHEHFGSFHTQATPDEKLGREPNNNLQAEELVLSEDDSPGIASTATKKRGRKKKKTPGMGSKKKLKCPQTKEPSEVLHDSLESSSPLQYARFLRSGKRKQEITHLHSNSDQNSRGNDLYNKNDTESGPITRLRKRSSKPTEDVKVKMLIEKQADKRKLKKGSARKKGAVIMDEGAEHQCDMDGCSMSFSSKQELALHKRNICSVKGCGKKFFSHKYLVQHRRVHIDDRPLKCPWKGCKMTFKWAWARTEHIRVHTGARPYVCHEAGCGQTFRFVSDFSRHKRKTGHSVKKSR